MDEFLTKVCFPHLSSKAIHKKRLPGDGGHRLYFRVRAEGKSFVLMSCGLSDPSLKSFVEIQKILKVPVPEIFFKDLKKGLLLLEDLGDESLEKSFFEKGRALSLPFYCKALLDLIHAQRGIHPLRSHPWFDKAFFLRENEAAARWIHEYVELLAKTRSRTSIALPFQKLYEAFQQEMEQILSRLEYQEAFVFCHRDFHSRNLMLKRGRVIWIDFQDAGFGPSSYDLCSLLYDSYVPLTDKDRKALLLFYFENLPPFLKNRARSPIHIEAIVKTRFLQRGFKACGAFAAFKVRDKKDSHLKYILPNLERLKQTAYELSYSSVYHYMKFLSSTIREQKNFFKKMSVKANRRIGLRIKEEFET